MTNISDPIVWKLTDRDRIVFWQVGGGYPLVIFEPEILVRTIVQCPDWERMPRILHFSVTVARAARFRLRLKSRGDGFSSQSLGTAQSADGSFERWDQSE